MSRRQSAATALAAALVSVGASGVLAGCSGDDPTPAPTATPTPSATPTPTPPPRATPVTVPADDACYRLTYRQAVSPTNGESPVPCTAPHTAQTYQVGRIDNVVGGHLLAVDSDRVQKDVAQTCPAALGAVVGGTLQDQRLSMLRSVWFTPSLEQAGKGAAWYRCDVVALAGAEDLLDVRGSLAGVLDTPAGRDRYGMCGTASPAARTFERVPCSAPHTWRAFSVIALDPGRYPGAPAVDDTGAACEDAAAGVAADPLDYEWAYEGPDAEQWAAGQTFVRCWAPD
ncbi:septum formation family protein [Nocardioides rubriscoriae]|uniref:septum formation family protein n=1 Tax=Nocardioides rubriscoriae TaxID=642762 RepID=UPI0011DFEEE3|nr:septum formation family protein [Nocardioides rubriscoriae]